MVGCGGEVGAESDGDEVVVAGKLYGRVVGSPVQSMGVRSGGKI